MIRAIKIYLLSDWEAYLVSLSRDGFVLPLHSWFFKKNLGVLFVFIWLILGLFLTCVWREGAEWHMCLFGTTKIHQSAFAVCVVMRYLARRNVFFHSPLHKIWSLVCGLDCTWTIYAFQHRIRQSISRVCCWCTLVKLQQYLKAMVAFCLLWFRHVT